MKSKKTKLKEKIESGHERKNGALTRHGVKFPL